MDMPRWLNEKEVSEITGLSLSTLRNSRHAGVLLNYYKINKSVRYKLSETLEFMEKHRIETDNE